MTAARKAVIAHDRQPAAVSAARQDAPASPDAIRNVSSGCIRPPPSRRHIPPRIPQMPRNRYTAAPQPRAHIGPPPERRRYSVSRSRTLRRTPAPAPRRPGAVVSAAHRAPGGRRAPSPHTRPTAQSGRRAPSRDRWRGPPRRRARTVRTPGRRRTPAHDLPRGQAESGTRPTERHTGRLLVPRVHGENAHPRARTL
jgi:hypothetical protein